MATEVIRQPRIGMHSSPEQSTALSSCKVMEGMNDLAEALLLLPNLQHLSITQTYVGGTERRFPLPIVAIGTLQQLTHLELAGDPLQDVDGLGHLQGLTNLQYLKLNGLQATIRAGTLFAFEHLTHLEVTPSSDTDQAAGSCSSGVFEPVALAGMTQLQHVELTNSSIAGGPARVAELLSHLQQHLTQTKTFIIDKPAPAALKPCVTLTASMQLQTVTISCKLSSQQVLNIAKQFPHLRVLEVDTRCQGRAPALDTSRLVSCCPELQSLVTPWFIYSAGVVAMLSEMSSLTKLSMRPDSNAWDAVCQMPPLRNLRVSVPDGKQGEGRQLLRHLTQLKELTSLDFHGRDSSCFLTTPPAGRRSMSQEVLLHISGREAAKRLKQLAQQGPKSRGGLDAATHHQGHAGRAGNDHGQHRSADKPPARPLGGRHREAVPGGDDGNEMDAAAR